MLIYRKFCTSTNKASEQFEFDIFGTFYPQSECRVTMRMRVRSCDELWVVTDYV